MYTKINGLRMFLLSILELMSKGEAESTAFIEESIPKGIASVLTDKYSVTFKGIGFNTEQIESVDNYFKKTWSGCADGQEYRKYVCEDNEGFRLIITLALNEIF